MHRLIKKNRKNKGDGDLRLQWPTEEKGLDALDRELTLLMSVKRWVAGATGGQTPRSINKPNNKTTIQSINQCDSSAIQRRICHSNKYSIDPTFSSIN